MIPGLLGATRTRRPCRLLVWAPAASDDELLPTLVLAIDPVDSIDWIELWCAESVWDSTRKALIALGHEKQTARIVRLTAPKNVTHWTQVMHSSPIGTDADLAWVVGTTQLASTWLIPLRQTLNEYSGVATCSPLCVGEVDGGPFSVQAPPGLTLEQLQRWLLAHQPPGPLELGEPLHWAGVMSAAAVNDARALALRNAYSAERWSMAWSQCGWLHLSSRRACVRMPSGAETISQAKSTLLAPPVRWSEGHPFHALQLSLVQAVDSGALPATPVNPSNAEREPRALATILPPVIETPGEAGATRLHIMHSWGGGLAKWVHDFCEADRSCGGARNLILRSVGGYGAFGQRIELFEGGAYGPPLDIWELGVPIHATALAHAQYRSIINAVLEKHGVGWIIVSSLIGHSLEALQTSVPTLIVAHDHYPLCIALYASFGSECRSCNSVILRKCIQDNPEHRYFRGVTASDWESLRNAFVQHIVANQVQLIAPSPSVAKRWKNLMPALQHLEFQVVPHGINPIAAEAFTPEPTGRLRVVVLGRLSREKGGEILLAAAKELSKECEFLLIGCGKVSSSWAQQSHAQRIPDFESHELPRLLSKFRPNVGLLVSIVPETFSYALSELWRSGIPVIASNLGAFSDRIEHGVTGFLTPPTPEAVIATLREASLSREKLILMRKEILARPLGSTREMVENYRALRLRSMRSGGAADPRRARTNVCPESSFQPPEPSSQRPPIWINPEATWQKATRAFLAYTWAKILYTPKIPERVRRMLPGYRSDRKTAPR